MIARHVERSLIMSADDDPGKPNNRLLSIAWGAIGGVLWNERPRFSVFEGRSGGGIDYGNIWPGEHYMLLPAMVNAINGNDVRRGLNIVEIGTSSGMSALSILQGMKHEDDNLVTFDMMPWRHCNPVLRESDFEDGRLTQIVADLTDPADFEQHRAILERADFIFIDAAKDGICEPALIRHLNLCRFKNPPVVMFDDIKVEKMLWIWRGIQKPKLDITSFGHWSGTGLVEWTAEPGAGRDDT